MMRTCRQCTRSKTVILRRFQLAAHDEPTRCKLGVPALFVPPAWYNGRGHFLRELQMTPEEQAELGLNGFFAYKRFRVRPGPTANQRSGSKRWPTIRYWTARHDRGTPEKDAATVE